MLSEILAERNIPDVLGGVENVSEWEKKREEIKRLLQHEEYGFMPPKPDKIDVTEIQEGSIENFSAGKAPLKKHLMTVFFGGKKFSFPFFSNIPKNGGNLPAIIHINFRSDVPDRYMPNEEITDNGFALFSFCYKDITSDDNDFSNGLAGVIYEGREREGHECGKISMWAWALMRVMDYVCGLSDIDKTKVAACGHSRLGKTALLAGALDERFYCAFSNDSGCSGAAISRGKKGEKINDICTSFPYWFCKNYYKYKNNEHSMKFDQHFLISLLAPRKAYISSAEEDTWADPHSEMLSAFAASPVFELYGKKGLVSPDRLPKAGDVFYDGSIGYHLRAGSHYFSREDWRLFMQYIKKQIAFDN